MVRSLAALVGCAVVALGSVVAPATAQSEPLTMTSTRVTAGLTQPVFITHAPGDGSRLFVVEKGGRIKIIRAGQVVATPFLDITTQVTDLGESGCLGLAFAPDYKVSGNFYVFYTRRAQGTTVPSGSVIARFRVSGNADVADASSQQLVMYVQRGAGIHNGGWIGFGRDGYLWATLGDNASSLNAQNLGVAHGKLLRIDPTRDDFPDDPNRNFGVPASNPFLTRAGALPEIFAFGLRNPWRCSFDRVTGDFYIGDVGGSTPGEVDVMVYGQPAGQNFGWPCFDSTNSGSNIANCGGDVNALTPPAWAYPRSLGNSITGGYVYRGCAIPEAEGLYFFGDYGGARIWTMLPGPGGTLTNNVERTSELRPEIGTFTGFSTFGEDAYGELYVAALSAGSIYKIVPRVPSFRDANGNGIPDACEEPFCGPADLASLGGAIRPDNQLTADDLIAFLSAFFASDLLADLAGIGGAPGPDGQLTADDVVFFLADFFAGCP